MKKQVSVWSKQSALAGRLPQRPGLASVCLLWGCKHLIREGVHNFYEIARHPMVFNFHNHTTNRVAVWQHPLRRVCHPLSTERGDHAKAVC